MTYSAVDFYLRDVWKETLDKVYASHQVDEDIFENYFNDSRLHTIDDGCAIVVTPNFVNATLMTSRKDLFEVALEEVLGKHVMMIFKGENDLIVEREQQEDEKKKAEFMIRNPLFNCSNFNDKLTFGTFVVGRSNAQAQVAALTIASNPGVLYNPFFIYGNSGLGKTHLLVSIANKIKENFPEKKIAYISSGLDFVKAVTDSLNNKTLDIFKESFRDLDLLLIDDIQFLASKPKTQEVFFTIFNELVNNKKQICLTADRTPSEITGLEDRIISRFNQGLTVSIDVPEYETAVNILKMKINNSVSLQQNINEDVISYIAKNFAKDVRQLEGALTRLLFYSINFAPESDEITLTVAQEAFKDSKPVPSDDKITLEQIKRVVGDYYNLTMNQLNSKSRTKNIANARHIAMYLCRKLLDAPYKDIGISFGNRDHSTVINACEKVERNMNSSLLFKDVIVELESRIH